MSRTNSKASELSELVDWFISHADARPPRRQANSPEVQQFVGQLWPMGLDYQSPLNPVFLAQVGDLADLAEHPIWMSRDGLLPLLWFFHRHPTPKRLHITLLIHENHAPFVPTAWLDCVGAYRLESRGQARSESRRSGKLKLLLGGLSMDTYCPIKCLEQQLEALVKRHGRRAIANAEIRSFLLGRFDGYGSEHKHDYTSDYFLTLCRYLGTRIEPLVWADFEGSGSFSGWEYVELTDGLLCSDSYLMHLALRKGAHLPPCTANPYRVRELDKGGETVALSSKHQIRFTTSRLTGPRRRSSGELAGSMAVAQVIESALQSQANLGLPWPRWFGSWARGVRG